MGVIISRDDPDAPIEIPADERCGLCKQTLTAPLFWQFVWRAGEHAAVFICGDCVELIVSPGAKVDMIQIVATRKIRALQPGTVLRRATEERLAVEKKQQDRALLDYWQGPRRSLLRLVGKG
jgi:hypothetical protein